MTTSQESYILVAGETRILVHGLSRLIDGFPNEEHEVNVTTTPYPVESGASLTDHAVRQPYKLKLTGIVSDVRPGRLASTSIPLDERAAYGWDEFLRVVNALNTLTIITRLGTYRNMLITKGKAPQDSTTGLALILDLEVTEILRANITRTSAPSLPAPTVGPAVDRQTSSLRGRVNAPVLSLAAAMGVTNNLGLQAGV